MTTRSDGLPGRENTRHTNTATPRETGRPQPPCPRIARLERTTLKRASRPRRRTQHTRTRTRTRRARPRQQNSWPNPTNRHRQGSQAPNAEYCQLTAPSFFFLSSGFGPPLGFSHFSALPKRTLGGENQLLIILLLIFQLLIFYFL